MTIIEPDDQMTSLMIYNLMMIDLVHCMHILVGSLVRYQNNYIGTEIMRTMKHCFVSKSDNTI